MQFLKSGDVLLDLFDAAGSDKGAGHDGIAKDPGEGHLRERLAALAGHFLKRAGFRDVGFVHLAGLEKAVGLRGAGTGGNAVEVAVGEQALGQGAEGDAADAFGAEALEEAHFAPALEHGVLELVDEAGCAEAAEHSGSGGGLLGVVIGDAGIERFAGTHGLMERAHGFLDGGIGIGAVGIKDVDVFEAQAAEALIEAGEQILAGAPIAVGAGPHIVAGLGGDDELIAVGGEVLAEEAAEILFGGAVGRAVIVGEVEVGDAEREGAAEHGAGVFEAVDAAEVVPETEGNGGQEETARAAAAIGHGVVAGGRSSEHVRISGPLWYMVGESKSATRGLAGGSACPT